MQAIKLGNQSVSTLIKDDWGFHNSIFIVDWRVPGFMIGIVPSVFFPCSRMGFTARRAYCGYRASSFIFAITIEMHVVRLNMSILSHTACNSSRSRSSQ